MKYLIIGTGGVGGCLADFLAQAGKDVTCIAWGHELGVLAPAYDIICKRFENFAQ